MSLNSITYLKQLLSICMYVILLNVTGIPASFAGTLENIRDRGQINCGVNEGLLGFGKLNADGKWQGFDVDFCRALSAAIFNEIDRVNYVPLSASKRFEALTSSEIDLLSRNTTWTMERDVNMEFEFVGISYFDGQGFMVPKDLGLSSALELEGRSVCVRSNTTSATNVANYFQKRDLEVSIVQYENAEDIRNAYQSQKCDAYTTDRSALAAIRLEMPSPDDHKMLPEVISKEPLGPVVKQDDRRWVEIVRWVLFALINAEEAGITQSTFQSNETSKTANEINQVLGSQGSQKLGLDPKWPQNVIRHVGNYGEIFERHLGRNTPLNLPRGLNGLWTRQGILYAPPMK